MILESNKEINSHKDQIKTLTEKLSDMEVGFEYIKMYGFQSGHFEEVLQAYRKTGKFPNPEDFKVNSANPEKPKSDSKTEHLEEYIDGMNSQNDPFKKPQIKDRGISNEQPQKTIIRKVSMDIVDKLQIILMCTIVTFAISYV